VWGLCEAILPELKSGFQNKTAAASAPVSRLRRPYCAAPASGWSTFLGLARSFLRSDVSARAVDHANRPELPLRREADRRGCVPPSSMASVSTTERGPLRRSAGESTVVLMPHRSPRRRVSPQSLCCRLLQLQMPL